MRGSWAGTASTWAFLPSSPWCLKPWREGEICVDRSPQGSGQARVWLCWRLLCQRDLPAGHWQAVNRDLMPRVPGSLGEERGLALQEEQQEQLLLSRPSRELLWVSGDRAKSLWIPFKILSELAVGRVVSKEEPRSPRAAEASGPH